MTDSELLKLIELNSKSIRMQAEIINTMSKMFAEFANQTTQAIKDLAKMVKPTEPPCPKKS